jgi:hypothetical protein
MVHFFLGKIRWNLLENVIKIGENGDAMRLVATFLLGIIFGVGAVMALTHHKGAHDLPSLDGTTIVPQIIYGDLKAPVIVIEYSSPACGHCVHFKKNIWPHIHEKHIQTGKAVWILRPFPLMALDLKVMALAFCHTDPKKFLEAFYRAHERWGASSNPAEELKTIAMENGLSQEQITTCLQKKEIMNAILAQRMYAGRYHNIDATPGFVIGQEVIPGMPSLKELDALISEAHAYVTAGGDMGAFTHGAKVHG